MTKFIFDLDGTITKQETLPLISRHFNVEEQIDSLTLQTVRGNIPFIESFIRRVSILGRLPIDEISSLLEKVELYEKLVDWISRHQENCCIATGNLGCWTNALMKRVGCKCYTSDCEQESNQVRKLTYILRKESIVEKFKSKGHRVVFIGDGNNDVEAMRIADVAIASGLTHMPANSVLSIADYAVFNEDALCRQLNQLL